MLPEKDVADDPRCIPDGFTIRTDVEELVYALDPEPRRSVDPDRFERGPAGNELLLDEEAVGLRLEFGDDECHPGLRGHRQTGPRSIQQPDSSRSEGLRQVDIVG